MSVQFHSPAIFVADIGRSRQFYEGVLGQEVLMDNGAHVAYQGGFAIWQKSAALSCLKYSDPGVDNPPPAFELCFETEELDQVWQTIQESGARSLHPPQEQPWGQRVLRVYDPDGHILELAEPLTSTVRRLASQGLSVEEICDSTHMPEKLVQQLLKG